MLTDSIGRTRNGDKLHKALKSSYSKNYFAICNGSYMIDYFVLHETADEIDTDNNREIIYEFIRKNVNIDTLCQFCFPLGFRLQYRTMIQAIAQYRY